MEIRTKYNVGDIIWEIKKEDKYKKCPYCNGEGEIHTLKNDWICKSCKGTGNSLIKEDKWVLNKECRKIGKIAIEEDYLDGTNIRYFDNSYLRRCIGKEKDCFATKEEAQKECNRRNKG